MYLRLHECFLVKIYGGKKFSSRFEEIKEPLEGMIISESQRSNDSSYQSIVQKSS
jgi:hypothetical protein